MKRIMIGFLITLFMGGISFGLPTQRHTGLSWNAPTTNTDGSVLTDGAGYYLYWKDTSPTSTYDDTRRVQVAGIDVTSVAFSDMPSLPQGDLDFAVTTYDATGNESAFSNQVTHIPLVIPDAPVNLVVE